MKDSFRERIKEHYAPFTTSLLLLVILLAFNHCKKKELSVDSTAVKSNEVNLNPNYIPAVDSDDPTLKLEDTGDFNAEEYKKMLDAANLEKSLDSVSVVSGDQTYLVKKTYVIEKMVQEARPYTLVQSEPTRLRLQTRSYFYRNFMKIFGPEASAILIAEVTKKGEIYGGACDIYNSIQIKDSLGRIVSQDVAKVCVDGLKEGLYPSVGQANVFREANRVRLCEKLIDSSSGKGKMRIAYAINGVEQTLAQMISSLNLNLNADQMLDKKLILAYQLFYPLIEPNSVEIMALKKAFMAGGSDVTLAWRNLLLVLCMTPFWQAT